MIWRVNFDFLATYILRSLLRLDIFPKKSLKKADLYRKLGDIYLKNELKKLCKICYKYALEIDPKNEYLKNNLKFLKEMWI